MSDSSDGTSEENYYERLFNRATRGGLSIAAAVAQVTGAYLEGRPQTLARRKATKKERDRLFWSNRTVKDCPPGSWSAETMLLALARYLGQEAVTVEGLLAQVAQVAPDALVRAVRYSGLVLNQHSPRRTELAQAAAGCAEVTELCRVLDIFELAHRQRVAAVEMQKALLEDLSTFDVLIYASLFGFERLVPRDFTVMNPAPAEDSSRQVAWDAINDLIAWKLGSAGQPSLKLTDESIGRSFERHLRPILFETGPGRAIGVLRNLRAFHALVEAQVELNEFIVRSADAFSYDDGIRFVRQDDRLEIVEVDSAARAAWHRDGRKLERLHDYWLQRAMDAFVGVCCGRPCQVGDRPPGER